MRCLILMTIILAGCHSENALRPEGPKKLINEPNNDATSIKSTQKPDSSGMIKIKSRQFTMGTNSKESYSSERPAHTVKVFNFLIDETEVTNQHYKLFAESTHYKTVAERKPDWKELKKQLPPDVPQPDASTLVPASLVFTPPAGEVDLTQVTWWKWVPGASWRNPTGPGSSIDKLLDHPVVHIALEDAKAFCHWKKKRLPTEAEWELAARGGLENQTYSWGKDFKPNGKHMANTFQGEFPKNNLKQDGFLSTSAAKHFPANGYGLYDMIGNVWEWTSDYYDESFYESTKSQKVVINPTGPSKTNDPREPYAIKHVIKGGSFLCADSYCVNYRPSARLGASYDSGASHIGFRCAKSN
jgi:sulfatase modifying factor 1